MIIYPMTLGEERIIQWVLRVGVTLALTLTILQGVVTVAWSAG
jgi:hypothetical protein